MTLGFSENAGAGLAVPVGRPCCTPKGIRTPVAGLKGLSPSPLDDGGALLAGAQDSLSVRGNTGQITGRSGSNWIGEFGEYSGLEFRPIAGQEWA